MTPAPNFGFGIQILLVFFNTLALKPPYLTAPASMKANPHCMKNMMIDIMSRKKWSTSFGFFPVLLFHLVWKSLCVSFSYLVARDRGGSTRKLETTFLKMRKDFYPLQTLRILHPTSLIYAQRYQGKM